ncbi:YciI family protein [Subtercola lobariae]|uniref:YCII-related domain-containing protein n=1 Tax=Subtercola lobariae TaxID=1588641 RepID=A0A917BCB1_9MICO|nr:YciI family protein [Subtercola lobariae]GGF33770.1 hypothetical protein GCM10011399_28680 [Subtercola lobariae]
MSLYVALFTHPDEAGWAEHLDEHVQYLLQLIAQGKLRASGPLVGTPQKRAVLIISAENREEAEGIIAADPYDIHGMITDLVLEEWDPIFGAFNAESTRVDERLTLRG